MKKGNFLGMFTDAYLGGRHLTSLVIIISLLSKIMKVKMKKGNFLGMFTDVYLGGRHLASPVCFPLHRYAPWLSPSGVTVVRQWHNVVQQWRNSGETVAQLWRNSGVTVVQQWRNVVRQ